MAEMMRDFGMSRIEAWDELPLAQAFAYRAWNAENNPWVAVGRTGDGYIAQESERQP